MEFKLKGQDKVLQKFRRQNNIIDESVVGNDRYSGLRKKEDKKNVSILE